MIDLAAVAKRINALEGWREASSDVDEIIGFEEVHGIGSVFVSCDGEVSLDWCGNLTQLLPVLQIVAEAMAYE